MSPDQIWNRRPGTVPVSMALVDVNPLLLALGGGVFTWGVTALGASTVTFIRKVDQRLLSTMLGFAAGVMVAASFWSLLNPSVDLAKDLGVPPWLPTGAGVLLGFGFLRLIDLLLPHLHMDLPVEDAEGIKVSWRTTTLLMLAVTLHNIPEGLALGVAFGFAISGASSAAMASAIALTIGIGLQNFPEGLAIALPLRANGFSKWRAFNYGQLTGTVEPMAAVLGAAAVTISRPLLPYALAFAAGAMLFVVVEELIPEAQSGGNRDRATLGFFVGFVVMMLLEVTLS